MPSDVTTRTLRLHALRMFHSIASDSLSPAYVRGVEHGAYTMWRGDATAYCAHVRQLLFDLSHTWDGNADKLPPPNEAALYGASEWAGHNTTAIAAPATAVASRPFLDAGEMECIGDFMRCRACNSSDITWTQKQTRSADEPMTVFCKCNNCGVRWKQ